MTILSGNELWKRYGERDVVQGVDVEVHPAYSIFP